MIRVEISRRLRTKLLSALTAVFAVIAPRTSMGQPAGSGAMGASAGTLTGVVRDNMGSPVAGARVVSGSSEAITDSSGSFTLRGLASGALTLDVRRLGYEPLSSSVTVGDPRLSLELRMKPVGQMLPAVRVRARAEPYESRLAGFNARRAKKLGYYITRDEIERRNDFSMTAALRRIPGVRPYTMSGALGRTVRLPGSTCPPLVFVDGFPASLGSFDLDMIDLAGVEGVEVYLHGSAIPADFAGPFGSESCGVIAIWSLPFRPRRTRSDDVSSKDVAAMVEAGSVYLADRVDVQAHFINTSAQPAFPDSLLRSATGGRVVVQFVVDTLGDVELGTVAIVSSNHPEFTAAVRAVLPAARFEPARRQGHAVRELVSLPFEFDPHLATSASPTVRSNPE